MNWFTERKKLIKRINILEKKLKERQPEFTCLNKDEFIEYLEDLIINLRKEINAEVSYTRNDFTDAVRYSIASSTTITDECPF